MLEIVFVSLIFHSQLILTEFSGVVWPKSVSLCFKLKRLIDLGWDCLVKTEVMEMLIFW